jgi:hypothetical protein
VVLCASASNSSPSAPTASPPAITGRLPTRSESCPNASSDGMSAIVYTAKISVSVVPENPNRSR